MKVDVLLISGSFSPREGGAEKQLRHVLQRLADLDYTVVVLTQAIPEASVNRRELMGKVHVRRLGSRALFRYQPRLGLLTFTLSAFYEAWRLKPKQILSVQLGAASVVGSTLSRARRIPHRIRITGGGTAQVRSEVFSRRANRTGRAILRLIDHSRTTVVAPAKHLIRDFLEAMPHFEGKVRHIMNGVEKKDIVGISYKPQVAWYARKGKVKSYDVFTSVVEMLPEVSFVVIGDYNGPQLPHNVEYLGWQENPEYALAECSVLLNTSPSEGMPNTVLQALAVGCSVVGLNNPGLREIKDMYPDRVEISESSESHSIVDAIERRLYNRQAPQDKVPSISEVFSDWFALLSDADSF